MITKSDLLQAAANIFLCDVNQLEIQMKVYTAHSVEIGDIFSLANSVYPLTDDNVIRASDREIFYVVNEICVNCVGFYGYNLNYLELAPRKYDFASGGFFAKCIMLGHEENIKIPPFSMGQIIYYHIKRK